MSHCTAACQPVGKMSPRKSSLLVRNALWHLDVRLVGKGHPKVFGLSARIATSQVRVAEETRRGMAEHLVGKVLLAVRRLADREVAATALAALPAKDREGHNDAVALAEMAVHSGAHLDDFPHHLVSHDVARQHGGDEVVKEVQIRAADRAARDLDDRIAWILDRRVGNRVAANIFLAVPDESFHQNLPKWIWSSIEFIQRTNRPTRLQTTGDRAVQGHPETRSIVGTRGSSEVGVVIYGDA